MEWIYPSRIKCVSCKVPIPRQNSYCLCKECFDRIHFRPEQEPVCTYYEDLMVSLIHGFKYTGKTYLSTVFAEILHEKMKRLDLAADYLVSIPSSPKRQRKRGYNQSALLCESLSKRVKIPHLPMLERTRETVALNSLDPLRRAVEVAGAFQKKKEIPSLGAKKILLVDDILTTGATIGEAMATLAEGEPDSQIDFLILSGNHRE